MRPLWHLAAKGRSNGLRDARNGEVASRSGDRYRFRRGIRSSGNESGCQEQALSRERKQQHGGIAPAKTSRKASPGRTQMSSMTYVTCFSFCNTIFIPMGGPRALPEVLCALRRLNASMGDVSYTGFAPAPAETDGEASNPGPGLHRARKRGPRSSDAKEARLIKHRIN